MVGRTAVNHLSRSMRVVSEPCPSLTVETPVVMEKMMASSKPPSTGTSTTRRTVSRRSPSKSASPKSPPADATPTQPATADKPKRAASRAPAAKSATRKKAAAPRRASASAKKSTASSSSEAKPASKARAKPKAKTSNTAKVVAVGAATVGVIAAGIAATLGRKKIAETSTALVDSVKDQVRKRNASKASAKSPVNGGGSTSKGRGGIS